MRRFFRVIYYFGGVLLFVIIAIIGYTQTRSFKNYLHKTILSESHSIIDGELQLGNIEGSLVTGFSIQGISVKNNTGIVFSTERVEIKYDPFSFLLKRISISNAIIAKPRVFLYRSVNGTWNIKSIFKSTSADTTPSAWKIIIKRIELENADITFTDSLVLHQRKVGKTTAPTDDLVDYSKFHLRQFFLIASAQIQERSYSSSIKRLAFLSEQPHFTLTQFSGDFLLTNKEASAKKVTIETPNSQLRLDVAIKGLDVTKISNLEELEKKNVDLSLYVNDLDTKELKQFLYPHVDFLNNKLKLKLKVSGSLEDLNVEQLSIQMPRSLIQMQGQLRNLHHPADLEIAVSGSDNFVEPEDILDCLPGLDLPDLSFLGTTAFSLTYNGRPLDFNAHLSANTAAGNVDIDGKMKIEPKNILYSGTVGVQSLALGTILNNEKLSTNINAKISADGSGFDLQSLTGIAKVEIDTSSFNGLPIKNSVLVFDVADGTMRSHIAAAIGSGNYEISSRVNFLKEDSIKYNINGKIFSFDLADILKDKKYESDLSFDISAAGNIGAIARFDTAEIRFYRSKFNLETFESGEAKIIYNTDDNTGNKIKLTSTAADMDVDGKFTPASFIAMWDNSYRLITEAIAYRFQNLDSLRAFNKASAVTQKFQPYYVSGVDSINLQFRLMVKDLKPFGAFLHLPLAGEGYMNGKAIGDSANMQINGDLRLKQVGLLAETDTLSADTASVQYSFSGINYRRMLDTFNASLEIDLQNFEVNSFLFNQFSGKINAESDSSNLQLFAFIDSTAKVNLEGATYLQSGLMEFKLSKLKVDIGQYIAENIDTVRLALGKDGSRISSFSMSHESEEMLLDGYFSPSGVSDMNISLNGFLLSNLKQILYRGPYAKSSTRFGGIVNAGAIFRGSFTHPNIIVDIKADGVRADDPFQNKYKVLGRIDSRLSYFEHLLNISVKFMSKLENIQTEPDLLLSGSLPFEFVLAREIPHKLQGSVDLTLISKGMNLEFLDPFIPEISNLSGTMICDMKMKGPIDSPVYQGSMSLQKANLIFDPLGIKYILNGDLIPTDDRIYLRNFTIKNMPQEPFHAGTMSVSGSFTLLGLKLKQFDLLAKGDLKIMSEDKRFAGQKIYGNLFAATGSEGIIWSGNTAESSVRGELFVKDAEMVLPPEREAEIVRTSVVNITYKDDTSKIAALLPEQLPQNNLRYKNTQTNNKNSNKQSPSSPSIPTDQGSFLDGISYDMSIETQGPTTLRFIFNTQTSEELYADLKGRLYFNKSPKFSRLTGPVEVSSHSYYNFIKKFEATGQLLFTGDILNPELDVTAIYQGAHSTISADTTATSANTSTASQQQTTTNVAGTSNAPQVLVTLKINGTRAEPKTKITLQTKGYTDKDWMTWKEGDDEANAISFILVGQFRNELTDQQRMGLIGTNLGFALASSMVMGPISEAARRATYGVIQSVDVLYYGGQLSQTTDLRLTGQVGEAVIRAGGQVLNDIGNTNVSVELPFSALVNSERFRNLILTLERRVEGIQNTEEQRRASNGARLYYRITF